MQQLPPEDFLYIEKSCYEHKFDSGTKNGIFWMTSNRLRIDTLLEIVLPPKQFWFVSIGTRTGEYTISKDLSSWPKDLMCGKFFVVESENVQPGGSFEFPPLVKMNCIAGHPCLEDSDSWTLFAELKATFYICASFVGVATISHARAHIDQVLQSEQFCSLEFEEQSRLRQVKKKFWLATGPETGPETCIEPGCKRLRSRIAVRCIRHQWQWGEQFSSTGFKHL